MGNSGMKLAMVVAALLVASPALAQIQVAAGSYGVNCGAKSGNKTDHLAKTCNGQMVCRYRVDHTVIGDPAAGCGKTYFAEWRCGKGKEVYRAEAPAEAGFGSVVELSCQQQYSGVGINVVAGTYGANCGAQPGNKTDHLARACNGQSQCKYKIDHTVIGDPAAGCGKTYIAEWRCGSGGQVLRAEAPAEAGFGSVIELGCAQGQSQSPPPPGSGIGVIAATYGGNCRAQAGNKTDALARACNGKPRCDYVIDHQAIGDPAVGCPKDYVAQWQCGQDPNVYSIAVPPEAGFRKVARLVCP